MANFAQRSFLGGEFAPSLWARTDLAKYGSAARVLRNFICQRHGGVQNRPGSRYIAAVKNSANVGRLIRFVWNANGINNIFVIELGDHYARFYQAGASVVVSGVAAWVTATAYTLGDLVVQSGVNYYCTSAHTAGASTQPGIGAAWPSVWYALTGATYEIPTPWAAADLAQLQYAQSADVITLTHPSYPVYELSRYLATRWTLLPVVFAPLIAPPTGLGAANGAAGPTDEYWVVTAVDQDTGEESLASALLHTTTHVPAAATPVTLTWAMVPNALQYRIYRSPDGATFGLVGTAMAGVQTAQTNTVWSTASNTESTTTTGSFQVSGGQARMTVLSASPTTKAVDGKYTVTGNFTVQVVGAGAYTQGEVDAYYSRDGEARVLAGPVASRTLFGADQAVTASFSGTVTVPDNGYSTLVIDLVPKVFGQATSGTPTFSCTVDESGVPKTVSWTSAAPTFLDLGAAPTYAEAPPTQAKLFDAAGRYPAAVGRYQQRLLLANSTSAPEKVWGSRIGSQKSFTLSTPLQDDDLVSFQLAGTEVNAVQYLVDLNRLLVFTSGGVWMVQGDEGNNGLLKPTAINPRQISFAGAASGLAPLLVIDTPLYVQARGSIIRDLRKAIADFDTSDITLKAAHLFDGYTLVDWAYQQIPHSVVWAVRADGVLLGCTYLAGEDVVAWHHHDTDGAYENVVCVPEGSEDRVYVLVRRTVNGATVRYLEEFATRTITPTSVLADAFHVDAGLTYDGRNAGAETMTITGGVQWTSAETLTVTRSVGGFVLGDVGNAVVVYDPTTKLELFRVTIVGDTSGTVVTGTPSFPAGSGVTAVPVANRGVATTSWGKAVKSFAGLSHLEGKAVSVLADGVVIASPNNLSSGYAAKVVTGGALSLTTAAAVVQVGLPVTSDLLTLDIDTPQGASRKEGKMLVQNLLLVVSNSAGLYVGRHLPTGADPLDALSPLDYSVGTDDQDLTLANGGLASGTLDTGVTTTWDRHGRVAARQVDPLPAAILAAMPKGALTGV